LRLKKALQFASDCGLTTVEEALHNIKVRSFDLFYIKDIKEEIDELEKEFETSWLHKDDLISDAIKKIKSKN
jgi:hypothetical protein